MKTWMLCAVLAGAGCATTANEVKASGVDAREQAATAQVKAALDALPKCEAGAPAGVLRLSATTCTKMFCGKTCCNQCSWSAEFEGMNTMKVPVDNAKVRELLKVGEGGLECEVAAWGQALTGVSMAVEGTACVVR